MVVQVMEVPALVVQVTVDKQKLTFPVEAVSHKDMVEVTRLAALVMIFPVTVGVPMEDQTSEEAVATQVDMINQVIPVD